ncbi:hypothetical protein [Streptomyces sp. NPDC088246]|uniref:hypothetical protein n=1 Tax=Streptomyces sp. NPDC088246 TaxID=3365842 RepID=UPI0038088C0D
MSDSSGRASEGAGAPDHLDRLLARHAPGAAPRPGVVRVRPRLAGPFERVEAVRAGEPETPEPLWPSTPRVPSINDGSADRPGSREVHLRTERERTVVRADRAPRPERPAASREAEREVPVVPLLRPAAAVTPGPGLAPDRERRAVRTRADLPTSRSAASVPIPPGANAASAITPSPLRPSAADTAAARDAVRQATGRRSGRGGEQVVHVQIGRLEVTAAAPSGGGRTQSPPARRSGATVNLDDYLARGRE